MSFDAEGAAVGMMQAAGFDPDDTPGALAIAAGLGVRVVWLRMGGVDAAAIAPLASGIPSTIALRPGLHPVRAAWCIAHELGEIDLRTVDYRGEDVEQVAEAIAARLLMPRRAFRADAATMSVHELAEAYSVPETAAALRLAEVGSVDCVAVVTPQRIHVRAEREFAMPPPADLRRIARVGGFPEVRRIQLQDQPRRIALVA